MNRISKINWLILAANLAIFLMLVVSAIWPVKELQMLYSSDGMHRVQLQRVNGIDRIYSVKVDGACVFTSPDFAPNDRVPFRETLFWDTSGKVVVLEVGRHRVFGYDIVSRRELSESDLLAVAAAPDPPLWEYGYECEWPGIGRVRRDDNKQFGNTLDR